MMFSCLSWCPQWLIKTVGDVYVVEWVCRAVCLTLVVSFEVLGHWQNVTGLSLLNKYYCGRY